MPQNLNEILADYTPDAYSVKLVESVCNVVPFGPPVPFYQTLAGAVKSVDPGAKKQVLEKAESFLNEQGLQGALWMADALDTADSGITVYTGVSSAVKLYKAESGERLDALETDQQQAADAVLKGLGMAYMIYRLFPGGPLEKVNAFRELDAGKAMLFYYASVEVGLPFTDNAVQGGAAFLSELFDRFGASETEKLSAVTGEAEAAEAMGVMQKLMAPAGAMVEMASKFLGPIADAAAQQLPKALNVADKAAGIAATGADALPVWRYLGARLVAEYAVKRALQEIADGPPPAPDPVEHRPAGGQIVYTRSKAAEEKAEREKLDVPEIKEKPRGLIGWILFPFTALFSMLCGGC